MRIIKQGTIPPKSVYRGLCSNCQCIIEVVEGEVGVNGVPVGGGQYGSKVFACPTPKCGCVIVVSEYKS